MFLVAYKGLRLDAAGGIEFALLGLSILTWIARTQSGAHTREETPWKKFCSKSVPVRTNEANFCRHVIT